jgi:hypothetical protein
MLYFTAYEYIPRRVCMSMQTAYQVSRYGPYMALSLFDLNGSSSVVSGGTTGIVRPMTSSLADCRIRRCHVLYADRAGEPDC